MCWYFLTGTLIRRHRIPLPAPNDEEFYTVENFNVGQEIMLYSRTFKITVSTKEYPVLVSEDLNKIVENCIVEEFLFLRI